MSQHPLSRRTLLIAAPLCLGACVTAPTYRLPPQAALWPIDLPLSALEPQGFVIISRDQGPSILVSRHDDGGYTAVTMICTHRACALSLRRDALICPCHGSRFTLNGALTQGPAQTPLTQHPVTLNAPNTLQITER